MIIYRYIFSATSAPLVNRALSAAHDLNLNLARFITDDHYFKEFRKISWYNGADDGLVDSVRFLLSDYASCSAKDLLQLLVNSF